MVALDLNSDDLSVWSGMDTDEAIQAVTGLYGKEAATAAAHCAFAARMDGREEDYQFWFDIFQHLIGAGRA